MRTSLKDKTGEELLDEVSERLEQRRLWIFRMWQRSTLELLLSGWPTISSDDLHELHPIPSNITGQFAGPVFKSLSRLGLIRECGLKKTARPTSHARRIATWTLGNRAMARDWLKANPAIERPEDPQSEFEFAKEEGSAA